jgi:phosphatidylserine/phosphatidylglycerophosphate/cardiolipin synthase-like enzyme
MKFKPKRDLFYIIVIVLLIAACAQFYYDRSYQPTHDVRVMYNRDVEMNKEVVSVIRDANQFVYFAIYTFTRQDIKDALLAAKTKGLVVEGITDRDQSHKIEEQKKIIAELRQAGIPVLEQDHSAIMHLKTVVTEKGYASGSFNWTSSATNLNDEILEVGTDESIRQQYQKVLENIFDRYKK